MHLTQKHRFLMVPVCAVDISCLACLPFPVTLYFTRVYRPEILKNFLLFFFRMFVAQTAFCFTYFWTDRNPALFLLWTGILHFFYGGSKFRILVFLVFCGKILGLPSFRSHLEKNEKKTKKNEEKKTRKKTEKQAKKNKTY